MTSPNRERRFHPSLPGFFFLILALLVPLFDGANMVNADGDSARHVRHGETMLQQHDVIRVDSSSFTHPGKEFVGFEYGSQILLALSHRLGGTTGLALLTTLIVGGVLTLMAGWLLRQGVDPLLAVLGAVVAAVLTSIHWLARPHVFSWPFMMVLFFWLESPRRPPLWAFSLLFLLWANLHGAFVFGWILIGFYLAGHLLESFWTHDRETKQRERSLARGLIPAMAAAVVVTVINPYGVKLPIHVLEFFRDPWIPRLTQEFQSPDFLREHRAFLLALVGAFLILTLRPRPKWTHFIVIAGTAGMALIMNRNIVQFGLLAVPLLTLSVAKAWSPRLGQLAAVRNFQASSRTGRTTPYVAAGVVWLGLLGLNHGRIGNVQLVPDGFDPTVFPVESVTWARENRVEGRLFHEFSWGGYILYAWPEQPVFIDGGTDFYGGAFMRAQGTVLALEPGWRDSLAAWRIDLALLASAGPLSSELLGSSVWYPVYCDNTAVLLRHRSTLAMDSVSRPGCKAGPENVARR